MKHLNHAYQNQAKPGFDKRSWHYARFFTASLLQRISNTLPSVSRVSRKEIAPSTQVQAFHQPDFKSEIIETPAFAIAHLPFELENGKWKMVNASAGGDL